MTALVFYFLLVVGLVGFIGGIAMNCRLFYKSYKWNKQKDEEAIAHLIKGGLVIVKGTFTLQLRLDQGSEDFEFGPYEYAKNELRRYKRMAQGACTYELKK